MVFMSPKSMPIGKVGEGIVRRGLVGHDVDGGLHLQQRREDLCRIAFEADGERLLGIACRGRQFERVLDAVCLGVEVLVGDTTVDAGDVAVDADRDAVVHSDGERLSARPCRRDPQ